MTPERVANAASGAARWKSRYVAMLILVQFAMLAGSSVAA